MFNILRENDQLVVDFISKQFFVFGEKEGNIPLDMFGADNAFIVFFLEIKNKEEAIIKRVSEILKGTGLKAIFNGVENSHYNFVLKKKHRQSKQEKLPKREKIFVCRRELERDLFIRRSVILLKAPEFGVPFKKEKIIILDDILAPMNLSRLPITSVLVACDHYGQMIGGNEKMPKLVVQARKCSLFLDEKILDCQDKQHVFRGKDAYSKQTRQVLKRFNNQKKG